MKAIIEQSGGIHRVEMKRGGIWVGLKVYAKVICTADSAINVGRTGRDEVCFAFPTTPHRVTYIFVVCVATHTSSGPADEA